MKLLLIFIITLGSAFASSIKDSKYYNYSVYFTNPECPAYEYKEEVYSIAGEKLKAKPKNVYCKYSDKVKNQKRPSSPHYNIKKLISDPEVSEVFLTYLSFSNSDIANTLCKQIQQRNLKVTFIIDSKNLEREGSDEKLRKVGNCRPSKELFSKEEMNIPRIEFRGNKGGLGFAHNKIILAQYNKSDKVTVVFSSGNMSSGTVLHHENWHFLTTDKGSYFYQAHLCIKEGMLNHADRKSHFKKYIKACRKQIQSEPEDDIRLYIVPSDGDVAMDNIVSNIESSYKVDVAFHRFTNKSLISALVEAAKSKKDVRLIGDDDLFWSAQLDRVVGANMFTEYYKALKVVRAGGEMKYMQTNENARLLHHNKFVIFHKKDGKDAVHCGAGNFTKAAFSKNFENYYFITIPEVVDTFKKQYKYMWNELASDKKELPKRYVYP